MAFVIEVATDVAASNESPHENGRGRQADRIPRGVEGRDATNTLSAGEIGTAGPICTYPESIPGCPTRSDALRLPVNLENPAAEADAGAVSSPIDEYAAHAARILRPEHQEVLKKRAVPLKVAIEAGMRSATAQEAASVPPAAAGAGPPRRLASRRQVPADGDTSQEFATPPCAPCACRWHTPRR